QAVRAALSPAKIRSIARKTLADEQVAACQISIAFVDHATMHELNRRHLDHDESTDVLSFLFEEPNPPQLPAQSAKRGAGKLLDGELIICADMARDQAPNFGWQEGDEMALYLIHGLLHLCGYDDLTTA